VLAGAPRVPTPASPDVERVFQLTDVWDASVHRSNTKLVYDLREYQSNIVNSYNVHALANVIEDWKPDVAYVHNVIGLGALGLLACLQFLGVPWVWQLGDCIPPDVCGKLCVAIPGLAEEFRQMSKGHYILVSERLVTEIKHRGADLGDKRIHLIPYWVVSEGFRARQQFFRPGQTLRIVSAGQISVQKGSDIIVKMAGIMRSRGMHDFRIDLYGTCVDHSIQAFIQALELTDHVFLKGVQTQAELAQLHRSYDLFLFPTWAREPFGLAPIEAAANGCVPLMSDSGAGEWVVDGVHCLKAERTAEAFAEVAGRVYAGDIPLETLAKRACAVVLREFHIDHLMGQVERVLRGAADDPPEPLGTVLDAHRLAILAEKFILAQAQVPKAA